MDAIEKINQSVQFMCVVVYKRLKKLWFVIIIKV